MAKEIIVKSMQKKKITGIQLPTEKAFYFWKDNQFLGVRAASLLEFAMVLETIDAESIRYHLSRGDFQKWLTHELEESKLAEDLNKLKLERDLEAIRKEMLRQIYKRL